MPSKTHEAKIAAIEKLLYEMGATFVDINRRKLATYMTPHGLFRHATVVAVRRKVATICRPTTIEPPRSVLLPELRRALTEILKSEAAP